MLEQSVITDQRIAWPEQFSSVRSYTEDLCRPLRTEDYIPQPVPFISPPKWHLAHTTWFFEEFVLKPYAPSYQVYHRDYSFFVQQLL